MLQIRIKLVKNYINYQVQLCERNMYFLMKILLNVRVSDTKCFLMKKKNIES